MGKTHKEWLAECIESCRCNGEIITSGAAEKLLAKFAEHIDENPTSWDDLQGKPFGTKKTVTEIIPEMTCGEFVPYGDDSMVALIPADASNALETNIVYTVMWDGVEYKVESSYGGMDFPAVGTHGGGEYPFHIFYTEFAAYGFPENCIVVASSDLTATSHTFSVSIVEEEITPIPAEYMPTVPHFYIQENGGVMYLDEACTEGVTKEMLSKIPPCGATISSPEENCKATLVSIDYGGGFVMYITGGDVHSACTIDAEL